MKTRVYQTGEGVEFLGFRIFSDRVRLRKDNVWRFVTRLETMREHFLQGHLAREKMMQRITSWIAHARWADTVALRCAMARAVK